jgi:putative ABC transport system substrate-binding protein
LRRREFITLLGGAAAAWPLAVRAQQAAMPVVGWIGISQIGADNFQMPAVHRGLAEAGFVAGRNLVFEYRSVDFQLDRLPAVASELVQRPVTVLGAGFLAATLAARTATQTIPIVFVMGANPVERGVVASLARPGGNITGITNINTELISKRLEMLHELAPGAMLVDFLVNPTGPLTASEMTAAQAAAAALGLRLRVVNAALPGDLEEAFKDIARSGAGALLLSGDALFLNNRLQIVELVARIGVPAIYAYREVTQAGGLMSYNTDLADAYRLAGTYVGRILKGEKPADLPVQQSTKIELVINLKTAKALGITFPLLLLGRADEIIE